MSDDELEAEIARLRSKVEAKKTGGFKLTDYAPPEDQAGPVTRGMQRSDAMPEVQRARAAARLEGGQGTHEDYRLTHEGGDIPGNQRDLDEETAKGFAQFAAGGLAGMGVGAIPAVRAAEATGGSLARGVAGGAQGAASGAAGSVGESPRDMASAVMLGALTGGAISGAPRSRPFAAGGQQDIDQQALADVGGRPSLRPGAATGGMFDDPNYRSRRPGSLGTQDMAREAEAHIGNRVSEREVANGQQLGQAEDAARARLPGGIDTGEEVVALDRIRQQSQGGAGPTMPEADARLADAQRQLHSTRSRPGNGVPMPVDESEGMTRPERLSTEEMTGHGSNPRSSPDELVSNLSFDQMRNLQKALNYRMANAQPGDLGRAGDKQAAGVVSEGMHRADPEFGQALDRYGTEEKALAGINENLYSLDSAMPPTAVNKKDAAVSRLARYGSGRSEGEVAPVIADERMNRVAEAEPSSSQFMAKIRARNTAKKREFGAPSLGMNVPSSIGRTVLNNADNLQFRALGQGVQRTPAMDPVMLLLEEQDRERQRTGEQR